MFYPDFTKEYLKNIEENPDYYGRDYFALMEESVEKRKLYKDQVIPMTYQGIFLEEEQIGLFQKILSTMASIGRKVRDEFVRNPLYRKGFHFDPITEELILIDPGYSMPVPIGRYDIFYNGGDDFKFCELNTDGSSAMNEDRVLGQILLSSKIIEEMQKTWIIKPFELFDSLVSFLTSYYEQIKGKRAESVAILDFMDKATSIEFQVFQKAFEKRGFPCYIVDPRDLRYKQGKLYFEDHPIDLIYRRLVTSDAVERIDFLEDLLKAYQDQAVIMMGSFQSQIMHSKLIFSVLQNDQTKKILSQEEWEFVNKHLPKTYELLTEEDKKEVLQKKDSYILKPYNAYASQGILLGREHSQEEWGKKIAALPMDSYIYQEYIDMDPTPFVVYDKDFSIQKFSHVLGLFMYGEKFAGSYTRIGQEGLISGARKYFTTPVFKVSKSV